MNSVRTRHRNHGLRKLCGCARRQWPKCSHSWYFNFKPKGGQGYRFSVDSEAGRHVVGKGEAETLADGWRAQIRSGTFRRRAEAVTSAPEVAPSALTLEGLQRVY